MNSQTNQPTPIRPNYPITVEKMNAQDVTDLNNSLKSNLCGHGNRHAKAWILVWGGTPLATEDKERKVFKEFLSDTLKIETQTVEIRGLRDPAANLAANLDSCTVLIMYYLGTGAVTQDGPVWKPTPKSKPHHKDTRLKERDQDEGVPRQQKQNNELHWSELKAIIAGLKRETLLITDCDYRSNILTDRLFSAGPANLGTVQVLTSIP